MAPSGSQSTPNLAFDRPFELFFTALDLKIADRHEDAIGHLYNLILNTNNLLPILEAFAWLLLVVFNSDSRVEADRWMIPKCIRTCLDFKEERLLLGLSEEEQRTPEIQWLYQLACQGLGHIREVWQDDISRIEAEVEQAMSAYGQQFSAPASTIGESPTASQTFTGQAISAYGQQSYTPAPMVGESSTAPQTFTGQASSYAATKSGWFKCDYVGPHGPCQGLLKDRHALQNHLNIHTGARRKFALSWTQHNLTSCSIRLRYGRLWNVLRRRHYLVAAPHKENALAQKL
jgi:hypothetical protein